MKTTDTNHTRYGASELKEGYNRHLGLSLFLSIALHALAVGVYLILNPAMPAARGHEHRPKDSIICVIYDQKPKEQGGAGSRKGGDGVKGSGGSGASSRSERGTVVSPPRVGDLPVPTSTPLDDSLLAGSMLQHQGPFGGSGGGNDTLPNGGGMGRDHTLPPGTQINDDTLDSEAPNFAEVTPEYDPGELSRKVKYPEIARRVRLEGIVVVRVLVDRIGRPRRAMVDESPSPLLSQAAMDAVLAIAFTPAIQNGTPVPVWIQVPITFKLD